MTDPLPFFSRVPWYWEGALVPLTQPRWFVHVVSALARSFGGVTEPDDEDRRLVHALVAVKAPRGDRVWLRFQRGSTALSYPEALRWLRAQGPTSEREGLARWCAAVEIDFEHAFDLAPAEFHARCLPHYRGFLHAWTDEHTARRHYMTWPQRRQAEFAHEYLLYAANDARHAAQHGTAADEGLQHAAAWLLSRRRFIVQWTLTLRDEADARAPLPREADFSADLQELIDVASRDEVWAVNVLTGLHGSLYAPPPTPSELERLLQRLDCDEGRLQTLRFWETASSLEQVSFTAGSDADALRPRALGRCAAAQRWAW
jgi:hypothetical protein